MCDKPRHQLKYSLSSISLFWKTTRLYEDMPFWHHILTWIATYEFGYECQHRYHRQVKPPADGYVILLCAADKCVTNLDTKWSNPYHPLPYFRKLLYSINTCLFYLKFWPELYHMNFSMRLKVCITDKSNHLLMVI